MARMSNLDPALWYLSTAKPFERRKFSSVVSFRPATSTTPAIANVMVEVQRHDDVVLAQLRQAGFVPRTRAGNVMTGEIAVDRIQQLERVPGLKRAEACRRLRRELDFALPEARVVAVHIGPPSLRGAGVIVGVIDHGIDYRHESFRKADGTSRILAIWDQGLTPKGGEAPPAGFDYGVEYTQAAIDAALNADKPLLQVRHADRAPFHGTHVAGIAAGNGRPADPSTGTVQYVGVAPDADLIVVANTRGPEDDPGSFGDSADTLDGVSYILQFAQSLGRPVAINLSQGDNLGPHDGTSLLEVGIANLITGPGCALIKSAGNEGDARRHAEGVLPASGSQDVEMKVPGGETEVIVDIWYAGADRIAIRITPPGGAATTATVNPPFNGTVPLSNGNTAFIGADLDAGNGDNRTLVVLQPGSHAEVEQGIWTCHLEGKGPWHAWIQRNSSSKFQPPFECKASTISIPGTSTGVITVGSYISYDLFSLGWAGTRSDFSSYGPTRDGRPAPTLSAPGEEIRAPQHGDKFTWMEGTSMSAPVVTGAVALMFEVDGTKTASDIRACLEGTARLDADTGAAPGNAWGAGKLDVEAACNATSES
jgi:subtilisin family serine protease